LDLSDELRDQVLQMTGERTLTAAIHRALALFVELKNEKATEAGHN
jgi:hypothetical protein